MIIFQTTRSPSTALMPRTILIVEKLMNCNPNNNAIIIMMLIVNFKIDKIIKEIESLTNIILEKYLERMNILDSSNLSPMIWPI